MPTWKKVIVSGSNAQLATVTASVALQVGTNQYIGTTQATTYLTGSFTGSFTGNGAGLTGISATSLANSLTNSDGINSFTFNGSAAAAVGIKTGSAVSTNTILKWDASGKQFNPSSLTDTGTVITGTTSIQLTGASSNLSGSFSGSFFGAYSGNGSGLTAIPYSSLTSVPSGIVSASSLASSTQGQVTLTTNGVGVTTNLNSLQAADTPTFAGINANGVSFGLATATATAIQIGGSGATVTVPGNLTVNGTTTIINTTNTEIKDSFILLASGSSSSATDGGIIVQGATQGTGSAFYWDGGLNRWAVANSIASSLPGATGITTPNSFIVTVSGSSGDPIGDPYYGAAAASRIGNMYVDTSLTGPSDNNIWIWA